MPSVAQAEYGIKDIWNNNLEEEFRKIRQVIQQYKYVAMVRYHSQAYPGSEFVVANTLAKWKKLEPNKVSKSAKIRNRYNQVPHLTQDTNGKVTNSQLDTTNESQEVSPFPAVTLPQSTYKQALTKT